MPSRRRKRSEMEEATFSWEVAPHKTDMTFLELEPYQSEGQKQSWKRAVRSQAAKASHHTRRLKEPSFAQHARASSKAVPPKKKVLPSNTPRPVYPYQSVGRQSSSFSHIDPSLESYQASTPTGLNYQSTNAGPTQSVFCLQPPNRGMETLPSNASSVNSRVHYSEPPCYFSQVPGAFQTPDGSFSTERDSLSPGETHVPTEAPMVSTTYDGYQPIPGVMLTPPVETRPNTEQSFYLPSMDQSVLEPAVPRSEDQKMLLAALQSSRFTSFASTDLALSSAVRLAVESINASNGRAQGSLADAESQAILDIHNALSDPSRASSDQLIASVAIMAMSSMLSGNQSTFYRHSAGLLDMFANKATGTVGSSSFMNSSFFNGDSQHQHSLSPTGRYERSQSMY